ncbi:hypothetical protein P5673_030581 [Acropora cervicornis]|uniref:VWFA domain-containing protein n=1 Tax=Acropora cervicornis TaxID=6130 RepID=A0AAD9UT60_ACRCE|nr:hypothetical protein P5673_030581 [Acropora cervicornis]
MTPRILRMFLLEVKRQAASASKSCNTSVDLAFIIDSSASISRRNYVKVKNFVKYVARGFGISPSESRAGIVLFSSNASINVVTYSHRRLILGLQNTKLCYNCLVSVYVLISPRARLQEGSVQPSIFPTTPNGPKLKWCKKGWIYYEKKCYLLVSDSKQTWENARNICREGLNGRMKGDLVTVDDQ